MAATFTTFTIEEMAKFLKRAFFALKPKQGMSRGEYYFDLNLSDEKILIRVWTSVSPNGSAMGSGTDAIRVTMISSKGSPLKGKEKIVKRTQNWKSNLQDRIEGLVELYESKADYWKLHQDKRDSEQSAPPTWQEDVEDQDSDDDDREPREHKGTFASFNDGYAASIPVASKARPGDTAVLSRRDGRQVKVQLLEKIGDQRGYSLWFFKQTSRYASEDGSEELGEDFNF